MERLNYTFFEEYKRLDKLCGDLYGEQYGVSCYIEDMKTKMSKNDYRNISNWTGDLQQLIRLRHIRNHLAHTEGAFGEKNGTQEDIAWISGFYERILNRTDSLAMLYRYSEEKRKAVKKKNAGNYVQHDVMNTNQQNVPAEENNKWKGSYWMIRFLIIACAFGLIAIVQYYFLSFYK